MSSATLPAIFELYPQKREAAANGWLDRVADRLRTAFLGTRPVSAARLQRFVRKVNAAEARFGRLDGDGLRAELIAVRRDLRRFGPTDPVAARAFALVRLKAQAVLGMRHFDAQIRGGHILLNGNLAEMNTGEGKTLTATLAAATIGLAGWAVHVITVNDYLARRDSEAMGPLFEALGLTTGLAAEDMDIDERRRQYRADIVYCTSKTLAFDYLRDRIQLSSRMTPLRMALDGLAGADGPPTLLRGLQYAIVDEADSVFVDEARTPLIISVPRPQDVLEVFYVEAVALARTLEAPRHYTLGADGRRPELTEEGRRVLAERTEGLSALWRGQRRREETMVQALFALHGFRRDIDYIVRDGRVMIVDENTGRVMPDRSWERGLQQMIEIREGVPVTAEKETLARISFQHFFRRYLRLSGMSGTCREVAGEIGEVYGLPVVRVAPHRRLRRRYLGERLYATAEARWDAVVEAIRARQHVGQPVLVGTRSIAASEELSRRLSAAGVSHQVLNAKQDGEEAAIVARAGEMGQVTIATNMAGRGTDIRLGAGVEAVGGLHVIVTERHDNTRVDRQLVGRCARQGDPGSYEAILSLEDELLRDVETRRLRAVKRLLRLFPGSPVLRRVGLRHYRKAQRRVERSHRRIRRGLLRADDHLRQSLSFAGQME